MALSIAPLFSGSSGNCVYIRSENTRLLVDAGLSCTKIGRELQKVRSSFEQIDGILVTHEHTDHICGLDIISKRYDIPIYANVPTWERIMPKLRSIRTCNIREITTDDFYIGDICVQPFEIPHDAVCPYGYALESKGKKVAVMTDLGRVTKRILEYAKGASIVLLEANHDVDMLNAGPYPYFLKHRILSGKGHLSNDDAAKAALLLAQSGVRGILLGHLSIKNNVEELAYRTVCNFLACNGVRVGEHVGVALAKRNEMTGCYDAR